MSESWHELHIWVTWTVCLMRWGRQDGEPPSYLFSPYHMPDIARWWGLKSEHTSFPVLVGLVWWEIEINRSSYNVPASISPWRKIKQGKKDRGCWGIVSKGWLEKSSLTRWQLNLKTWSCIVHSKQEQIQRHWCKAWLRKAFKDPGRRMVWAEQREHSGEGAGSWGQGRRWALCRPGKAGFTLRDGRPVGGLEHRVYDVI